MKQKTKQRRIDHLVEEIRIHPHKNELLQLMHEQLDDDLMTCATVHNQQ